MVKVVVVVLIGPLDSSSSWDSTPKLLGISISMSIEMVSSSFKVAVVLPSEKVVPAAVGWAAAGVAAGSAAGWAAGSAAGAVAAGAGVAAAGCAAGAGAAAG